MPSFLGLRDPKSNMRQWLYKSSLVFDRGLMGSMDTLNADACDYLPLHSVDFLCKS